MLFKRELASMFNICAYTYMLRRIRIKIVIKIKQNNKKIINLFKILNKKK